MLDFANEYGQLHWHPLIPEQHLRFEWIGAWHRSVEMISKLVRLWSTGLENSDLSEFAREFNRMEHHFGQWRVALEASPGSERTDLRMVPTDLFGAIRLQLAQAASINARMQSCVWCSKWFIFGSGTGRRKSAHYCSDRCRKAAHHARKVAAGTTVSQTTQPKKP